MDVPQLVKNIRTSKGWTQTQMGDMIGVGRSQISNIESGRFELPASKLLILLKAAGWTLTPPA